MAAVSSQLLKSQKKDKNGNCCSRPNPSLLQKEKPHSYGEEPAEKNFCFLPMVQRRAPVSPGLLLSHILRQNLPFNYHSKVSKWIVFVELPSLTPHSEHLGVRNPMFSCAGGWYWGEIIFSATILNFLPPGQSLGFTVQLWVKVCGFFFNHFFPFWYQSTLGRSHSWQVLPNFASSLSP